MTLINPTAPEYQANEDWAGGPLLHVQRRVVQFLQGLFAQAPPGSYQWKPESLGSPEQKDSEIFIGHDTPIYPNVVGQRPAITVMRGSGQFSQLGIGARAFTDLRTGGVVKMDLVPTTVIVNVLSQNALEAETLAWVVAQHLWIFSEEIVRDEEMFHDIRQPTISAPSPAGSLVAADTGANWVVVVVSMAAYLNFSMTKVPYNTGPRTGVLQGVTTTLQTTTPQDPPQTAVPLQGTAVMQPRIPSNPEAFGSAALPSTGGEEAQSTEPLKVVIKT